MKKILKNYKETIKIFGGLVLGFFMGVILKEKAIYLAPIGKIFINLLCTLIVPIIFTSIVSSICNISFSKLKNIFKKLFFVLIIMSLVSALVGLIATISYKFVSSNNNIILIQNNDNIIKTNIFDNIADSIAVDDFNKILSKNNMVALIVFSIIFAITLNKTKKENLIIIKIINGLNSLTMKMLTWIMKYAWIGLGAYFASQIGVFGVNITTDYLKVFIYYSVISVVFAGVFYSIIAILCNKSLKIFWKESMPVIATSLSTCSSAATIPVSISSCQKLKIDNAVTNVTIPIGTNFHKDGSIIDSVFKIMFLVYLFNKPISITTILGISLLSSLLISAIPIGGGTVSEILIITSLGFPIESLAILTIIATITDAPATMLNSLGNTTAALFTNKLLEQKSQ